MKLGELISLSRELKGWSLRELENRCGVSNSLLSQIETGHIKEPGFRTVAKIANSLGLSLKRLSETEG